MVGGVLGGGVGGLPCSWGLVTFRCSTQFLFHLFKLIAAFRGFYFSFSNLAGGIILA